MTTQPKLPDTLHDDMFGLHARVLEWSLHVESNDEIVDCGQPLPPGRVVGCDDPECCPEGPRELTPAEYDEAIARYERANAEWRRTGGKWIVKGTPTYEGTAKLVGGGTARVLFNPETWEPHVIAIRT